MNPDHAVGGLAATGLSGMLTTCLAYWQGVPADVAASEAGLIVLALGAVAGIVQALARGRGTERACPRLQSENGEQK
jgi:hypothetical protein